MQTSRPPIIVILGHVDHGKTTLLDYLRKSNVAAREAGGITQSIRSFQLALPAPNGALSVVGTFIDTPGHAAFSKMRVRGSSIADIAILIIDAVDGVMPQTIESIEAIKSAGIPFIVALNKVDKNGADPDRVKTQLTENDVVVEDFGGSIPSVAISAKTGQGVPELLEVINLVASLNPPQADPEGQLEMFVLESRLDSHRGPVAAVIVKNGTLVPGQPLFQSAQIGKAKALLSAQGENLESAPPSTPLEVLGLTIVPEVGSLISSSPKAAAPASAKAVVSSSGSGDFNIILKADVAGSLEAILASLPAGINVISASTGEVTENDVLTARNSNTRIMGFNIKISSSVEKLAEVEKVVVHNFKIIYELLEDLGLWLHPVSTEKITGRAEVLAEFKIGPDRVAGAKAIEGAFEKSSRLRLLRGDKVVGETKFKTLKQGKTDVQSVKTGVEFGATFSPYLDFKPGDLIIAISSY